ncbi:MAG: TonB-dependent receptor [Sphingomonadaceae bacterium]|nr:TonB-dependent receptor [Sphingomonadaceae bacterium]
MPGTANAQEEGEEAQASDKPILVTGTRIRGIDPTGSNVIAIGNDEFDNSLIISAQDLVNQIPQNEGAGFNEATFAQVFVGANTTRAGSVNLRGVGNSATLMLLDGHRIVPSGTGSTLSDPSDIPISATQRVEVIADGASAIYGADAVAGVYNVILRRDLDGVEAKAVYGFADDMDQWSVAIAGGQVWSTGQVMLAYEHMERSSLSGFDRSFYKSDNTPEGGTDYSSVQCNPGTLNVNGQSYPIPAGGNVTPADLVAGAPNRCDLTSYNDLLPNQNRESLAMTFEQDFTDWLQLSLAGIYSHRTFDGDFTTQGPSRTEQTLVIGAANPYLVLPAGVTPMGPVTVDYSFLPEYGALTYSGYNKRYEIIGGFNISLPSDWKVWLGGVYGYGHAFQTQPNYSRSAAGAALNTPDPAAAFNPFGGNSTDLIDGIYSDVFAPYGTNKIRVFELRGDGPLFEMPAGTARMAVGYEFAKNSFFGGSLLGSAANPSTNPSYIDRKVHSVFSEIYLPLVDSDGFGTLDLSAALRYDDYSDFGSTTNPKVGLTYEPTDGLTFNASYGTSFRAPQLDLLPIRKQVALISSGTRLDPTRGNVQVPTISIIAGNPDLEPEEATTWSFGATWEPASVPGLRANINYFSLKYTNQITSINNDPSVLARRSEYGDLITEYPTGISGAGVLALPEVQALIAEGVLPAFSPAGTYFYVIDGRAYNLGASKAEGLDFDLSYNMDLGSGNLTTRVNGSYFLTYKTRRTDVSPTLDQLNTLSFPMRFKARGTLFWSTDKYDLGAYASFTNAYQNPVSSNITDVSAHLTFDLHAATHLDLGGIETTLAVDARNVFDKDPPFVDVDGGYDPYQASAVGRLVTVSLSTKF